MYIDKLIESINNNWCMVEEFFNVENNRHYESVFAIGTGYMTTRSSIEEGFFNDDQAAKYERIPGNVTLEKIPESKNRYGTFMPVIQGKQPLWGIGTVNLPFFLGLVIYADGEKLDMEASKISGYKRWIDLRTATLYRTFVWESTSGKKIDILFKRFMNPELRFVCVQECRITMLSGTADIVISSFVDNDVCTNGFDMFIENNVAYDEDNILYSDVVTNLNNRIVTASKAVIDRSAVSTIVRESRRIYLNSSFKLAENDEAVIHKISAVIADSYIDRNNLMNTASITIKGLFGQDIEKLYYDHQKVWEGYWEISDVKIKANDDEGYNSQLAIRMALYHLLRAKAKDEERGMICPKGLTSEVYFGSVFWDMEIFIQPFYIYTIPEMARTTHMFRYHNLPAARKLAKKYDYKGARYPWQSSFNGEEACPLWQYAEHQVHITSDVVIGLWHYFMATDDKEFLFKYGAEIIIETARYWTMRVDKVPGKKGYQLYGVMGPDEYKPLSNNNSYTNYSVKFNLNLACKVMDMLKSEAPGQYSAITDKLSLKDDEYILFKEIADGISIPKDDEKNIIWQCDDFDTAYADIDINGLWKDRTRLFGLYVKQEKRYRSKTLKQSDVTALLSVFSEDFTRKQKEASFDYYDKYNIHDSSNSMCHHLIVAAAIGRPDAVYRAWKESMDIDFGLGLGAEDGIHCANVGGMWQEVVFGFAGMINAMNMDILTFNPCIPKQIMLISFKIYWKKNLLEVTIYQNKLEINNLSVNDINFNCKGNNYLSISNRKTRVSY